MKYKTRFITGSILTIALFAMATAAQFVPRANTQQLRTLISNLETKTDQIQRVLDRRMDNGRFNGTVTEDLVSDYLAEFENATDDLKNNFNSKRVSESDAVSVLNYGWYLDDFMRRNRLAANVENQWRSIRSDLNTLSRYYRVNWSWNKQPPFEADRFSAQRLDSRITGTYRLNTMLSDSAAMVVDRAIRAGEVADRALQRQRLVRRLAAPTELAIHKEGPNVMIASNQRSRVSFMADGVSRNETNERGRSIQTTASAGSNSLRVAMNGERANDFWVTFTPVGHDRLRVTRGIYLENRNETLTSTAVYDRVATTARWPIVDRNGNVGVWTRKNFYIPNGTQLTARLLNEIDSDRARVGDSFSMEVTSPIRYSGAQITGHIASIKSSGRLTGRANLALDFDTIRHGDKIYDFAGLIDSAHELDGDRIGISNEGVLRDRNQTTTTVARSGIGAALGAIIGAIAGGGDGAAIGAGVGAGAGAGSVLLQGRDDLDVEKGSFFSITVTGPLNSSGT